MDDKTIARFNAKVDRSGGPDACHPWMGYRNEAGYGRTSHILCHRLAFFLAHGHWPEPMCCHSCDNRPCCNPRHLFEGTGDDNIADMLAKGRQSRGETAAKSKLTAELALEVVRLRGSGLTLRAIGARVGIAHVNVLKVLQGKNWRHVTGL